MQVSHHQENDPATHTGLHAISHHDSWEFTSTARNSIAWHFHVIRGAPPRPPNAYVSRTLRPEARRIEAP